MKIAVFYNGLRGQHVVNAIKDDHYVVTFSETDDLNDDFIDDFTKSSFDLGICAGFSKILTKPLLDAPSYGFWNCHAGPVPEYRGGSPLNWQIIEGEEMIGISLLKMDEGIDTGPVISTIKFMRSNENIAQVHARANTIFPVMVTQALEDIDHLNPEPQPPSKAYRKQRNDDMGEIDLSWEPERIVNFVQALTHPYPGAWIRVGDRKLRIWDVSCQE